MNNMVKLETNLYSSRDAWVRGNGGVGNFLMIVINSINENQFYQ